MLLARPLEYWRPTVYAMMFESLEMIQRRDLPLMSLLSKYEWNLLGKCPASYLNYPRVDVMDV